MPSFGELASEVASRLEPIGETFSDATDFAAVVDEATAGSADIERVIREIIQDRTANPTPLTRELVTVPSRLIVTLNYDDQVEKTADELEIPHTSLSTSDADLFAVREALFNDQRPDRLTIVHLHGFVRTDGPLIFDPTTYSFLRGKDVYREIVHHLSLASNLCFVGTSVEELFLLAELSAVRRTRRPARHLLLTRTDQTRQFSQLLPNPFHHGIESLTYQEHDQLVTFFQRITTSEKEVSPIVRTLAGTPESFVELDIYRRGEVPTEEDLLADAILGRASQEPLQANDLIGASRGLIIGAPGSGKSSLLRRMAAAPLAGETPIFIRCADLVTMSGEASQVLLSCISTSESIDKEGPPTIESVRSGRFHLLFDGLDEQRLDDQSRLTRAIQQLSEQFPQHRFTVTSRPIPALSSLTGLETEVEDESEWEVFEITPSQRWRNEFLETVGVGLDELNDSMPALRSMEEVLETPFFLTKTVELYKDETDAAPSDELALVTEFVSSVVGRDTTIALPKGVVMSWLADVSTVMSLRGTVTIGTEELQRIHLPAELGKVVGSTSELISELAARLLLRESDGSVSFVHRMFQEALFAGSLIRKHPRIEVLDSVAPIHGDQVSGVRSDLILPVTLAMQQNLEWREAVGNRDLLAASRATPTSATLDERLRAARAIWETYTEWGIWIWSHRRPALLNDAPALGRLVASEDMTEIRDEIRLAAQSGETPYIRGNALHVLAEAGDQSLLEFIPRVLRSQDEHMVVVRQAALAAAKISATELLPNIEERLLSLTDEIGSQDLAIAAFELSPEHEWVALAIRLVENKNARMIARSRLRRLEIGPDVLPYFVEESKLEDIPRIAGSEFIDDAIEELLGDG